MYDIPYKSMPVFKDDVIKSLTFIRVPDYQKATLDELSILATRFPIVIPQEDITQLDTEFLEYQCTSEIELPSYLNENKTPTGLILFGMKSQRSLINVLFNQNLNIYLS